MGFKKPNLGIATAVAARTAAPIVTLGVTAKPPSTFIAGEYQIKITNCDVRVSKKGTTSLIVTAIETESGEQVNLPPIWMGGGAITNAPTLAENHAVIEEMVRAAGADPKGMKLEQVATALTNLNCWVELGSDSINGRDCNRIVQACSLEEYEGN